MTIIEGAAGYFFGFGAKERANKLKREKVKLKDLNKLRKIMYTRHDGGLVIVQPVRNTVGDETKTNIWIENRAIHQLPKKAINPKFIEDEDIPKDRTFRNQWKDVDGKIVVDHTLNP